MMELPHGPRGAKSLEYKFSTPPVNVMVYDAEYDKMRQRGGSRRQRLHETIATRWHITAWSLVITRDLSWRMQMAVRVE